MGKHAASVTERGLPLRPFTESLPMTLLRAREAVMRLFRPGLRKRGVTEQQWRILRALAHAGPMEVSALAEETFLHAPSLSRILPDLERRGLISRAPVSSDLRRNLVRLGPKGLRLIAAHAPYSERMYAEIARRFGAGRITALLQLLDELEASLAEVAREQTAAERPGRASR